MQKHKFLLFIFFAFILFGGLSILFYGPRVANDFPYAFQDSLKVGFNLPQIWSERSGVWLGEFVLHTLWAWPVDFLYGLGGILGLNFSILEKILGIFPAFILGIFSIYKLLNYFGISKTGRIIGSIFYITNTYFLLLVDGGQLSIALAYSILPFVFLLTIKSIGSNFRSKLLSAISIYALGVFDIRFIYVLLILLFVYFIFNFSIGGVKNKPKYFLEWLVLGTISGILYIGLNAYWIFPALISRLPELPAAYTRVSQTSFLDFTDWKHAVSLLQPNWYKNIFGVVPPFRKEFLLIPILVFLAPILKRKDKKVWFWTVIALISVFLTKGASPPFGDIYNWLFIHLPGFSLFRDSTKFFFLVALSYSVLTAFTVDEIIRRMPKLKYILPIFLFSYFLSLISPVWRGQMTGIFSNPPNQKQYFTLAQTLEDDKNFGRVLWVPSKAPLGFASPLHPSVDALTISDKHPFVTGTVGAYEFMNFLRESPYMGEMFKVAGIKYIAYPYPDTRRAALKPEDEAYYHIFLSQLENLPWVSKEVSGLPVPVLEVKSTEDRFFVAHKTYLMVGSDTNYLNLIKIPNFDLAKYALVWDEEKPGSGNLIDQNIFDKIIIFGKDKLDLAASFIDKDKFIFPSTYLDFSPSTGSGSSSWPAGNTSRSDAGWWKRETSDFVWMRDFLQQKYGIDNADFDYGGGYAIAEGNKELIIKNEEIIKGDILLARVLKSSKGGKIDFIQGNKLIGEVDTKIVNPEITTIKLTGAGATPDKYFKYDAANFVWVNVGNLDSSLPLTIKTQGDVNIVNSIVVIQNSDYQSITSKSDDLISSGKVVFWNKLSAFERNSLFNEGESPKVTYKEIAPTYYKVNVSGLKNPSTLIFSESYDPMWTSNKEGSFPVYSLVNGFKIDSDGSYDIYFTPQKYILPGMVISGLTLFVLALIMLKLNRI